MAGPSVGDPAPRFSASDHDGNTVRLEQFRGRTVVLYFYPRSFTPGCTRQAQDFRDHLGELETHGAVVIGVSTDPSSRQCAFRERHGLGFTLLGDEDGKVCKAYGVQRALLPGARRVTFVIDPEGIVIGRFHHEVRIGQHVAQVLDLLQRRGAER
jgi:peroxiredoxin Q/BCP